LRRVAIPKRVPTRAIFVETLVLGVTSCRRGMLQMMDYSRKSALKTSAERARNVAESARRGKEYGETECILVDV
jgi:hypothetical protein